MTKTAYMLLLDEFADWEASLAASEINKSDGYRVVTVGASRDPVRSMGGLRVEPDVEIREVDPTSGCILLLPGGNAWEAGERAEVTDLIRAFDQAEIPIAAICGATLGLARAGMLATRKHTSNLPGYIDTFVPDYGGAQKYVEEPAVRDGRVITASGMAGVEFAYEIISLLELYSEADRQVWLTIFRDKVVPPEAV